MSRGRPYVGVSGISTRDEARACLDAFPRGDRLLMLGILASPKTLFGAGNSKPRRYPKPSTWPDIFVHTPDVLNLVHYGADSNEDLAEALMRAMVYAGDRCDGVQINVAWPAWEELNLFREAHPDARVVLQIGPRALEMATTPPAVRERVRAYVDAGCIDDVLLDASAGKGKAIDADRAEPFVAALRWTFPDLGIGIAGGFCAETLPAAMSLIREYDLSYDAEGRLRDDADGGGNLVLDKVRAYLAAAGKAVT